MAQLFSWNWDPTDAFVSIKVSQVFNGFEESELVSKHEKLEKREVECDFTHPLNYIIVQSHYMFLLHNSSNNKL